MPRRSSSRRRSTTRRSSSTSSTRSSTRTRRSTTTRPVARFAITDALVEDITREVISRLGLEDIGVSVDELVDLLRPVLESIADQYSSRPSKEQLLARLLRNQDKLLELIASYLADTREKLNEQQLEFVIYHGGTSIVRHVPRLYRAALEIGRDDLVDILRSKWIEGGVATPHQCPRCNFYSLTPALTCLVCGAEIDEKEFKEAIGFRELLEFFAQEASVEELRDAISEKRVLYDGRKIKAPSMARSTFDIELRLEPNEVKILEEALRAKKGESRGT